MVGHFGAFSKYGALMIAGKNDDRGATEFYDNLGFEICQVKVYQAQAKTPCENC